MSATSDSSASISAFKSSASSKASARSPRTYAFFAERDTVDRIADIQRRLQPIERAEHVVRVRLPHRIGVRKLRAGGLQVLFDLGTGFLGGLAEQVVVVVERGLTHTRVVVPTPFKSAPESGSKIRDDEASAVRFGATGRSVPLGGDSGPRSLTVDRRVPA